MDTVKSVKFEKTKKSPHGSKKFEKTPHSNKVARPAQQEDGAGERKKRKLNFSTAEDNETTPLTSPSKPINGDDNESESEKALAAKRKKEQQKEKCENTIYIGNLPAITSRSDIRQCFSVFGKVLNARIRGVALKKEAKSRRAGAILQQIERDYVSAFVRYETQEAAELAIKANGVLFEDRHLRIDLADPKLKYQTTANKAIFLRNIHYDVTEDQLWETFSQCGEIESVRIATDRLNNHQPRGMGYVNFASSDSVQLAINLGKLGIEFNGRKLAVYPYVQKKKENGAGADRPRPSGFKRGKKSKKEAGVPEFAGNTAEPKRKKEKVRKFRAEK